MDNSKISHGDPKVVSEVIRVIHKRFDDTTVRRGKKYTFLGIDMESKYGGTVELGMEVTSQVA